MKRRVRIKKLPKAKVGKQVDYSLFNDQATMGGGDYNNNGSQPGLNLNKFISGVPREDANVEAEGGETVFGDLNGDGIPEHQVIKGPRHSSGGVPLSLPEDTFIFSDTRSMKIKEPKLLKRFGKNEKKSLTPAKIAKQYDINNYRKILEDPNSDDLSKKTAELMIKNYNIKLGELALVQESMKGMPQGIPLAAKPAMGILGLKQEDFIDPQLQNVNKQLSQKVEQQQAGPEEGMEEGVAEAEEMNQGPVAQPQQQPPMSFGGRMLRAQDGGPITVNQAEVEQDPLSFYDYARGEYDYFINNPDMWNQDPDMMNPDGSFKFCLDCLVKDYDNPDHLQGIVQLMQEGLTEGPHNTEWADEYDQFYQALEKYEIQPPILEQQKNRQYGGEYADGGVPNPPQPQYKLYNKEGRITGNVPNGQEYLDAHPDYRVGKSGSLYTPEGDFAGKGFGEFYKPPAHIPFSQMNSLTPDEQKQAHSGPPAPLAAYGMAMGGYDMPFYDLPEAKYGRAIPKAQGGIEIREDDPDYDRKVWDANQAGKKVIRIGNDGRKQVVKYNTGVRPEYDEATMGADFGTTPSGEAAAIQYHLLQEGFKDPKIREKFYEEYQNSVKDSRGYSNSASQTANQASLEGFDQDAAIDNFMNMQKRNLMFKAKQIDPVLFSNSGKGFRSWSDVEGRINSGMEVINPATGQPITSQSEFKAAKKHLAEEYGRRDQSGNIVNPNNVSLGQIATGIGQPLEQGVDDGFSDNKNSRAAQQAGFHAYANMMNNAGGYDADTQFAIRNFQGEMQVGDPDQTGMAGYLGTNVSPIDDFSNLDLNGDGIFSANELDPNSSYKSTYGNTTAGELTGIQGTSLEYGCQCEDPDGDFYMEKDENGKCPCDPEEEKKCACKKKDGTIEEVGIDPATGDCLPCEENENILSEDEPAPWWLQDTIKTTGAFGDLMGIKKYMPWAPRVDLEEPDAVYADPTRELAQQAEQANIQTQAISQFSGAQAQSARAASIQGQASKQAADTLNQYNVNNIAAANQNEQQKVGIRNQEQLTNQQIGQGLYDQTTIANQQFDNAKLAGRTNLRNLYTNAITNRQKQQNLNSLNEQYDINPADGGSLIFKGGRDLTGKGTRQPDYPALYKQCRQEGVAEKDLSDCAKSKLGQGTTTSPVQNPGGYGSVNAGNAVQGQQKGGYIYDDGGFVYGSNVYPFVL